MLIIIIVILNNWNVWLNDQKHICYFLLRHSLIVTLLYSLSFIHTFSSPTSHLRNPSHSHPASLSVGLCVVCVCVTHSIWTPYACASHRFPKKTFTCQIVQPSNHMFVYMRLTLAICCISVCMSVVQVSAGITNISGCGGAGPGKRGFPSGHHYPDANSANRNLPSSLQQPEIL